MDTFADLIQAVQDDQTVGSESTLYNLPLIKRVINRAYRKAGGLVFWPELQDAKKTSTEANQEYYDYPVNWRPNSVWKLVIDSVDYGDPLVFKDYLYEKENSLPSGLQKMWTNQWRRYFIYPIPTANGSQNIEVYGQKVVDVLSADGDVTIFSYSMPDCNEAIVLEAVAMLKAKGDEEKEGEFRSAEAKGILLLAWNRIARDQAKYEKTQPFFEVPDLFRGNGRSPQNTGRFN